MEITEVRVKLMIDPNDRLMGFCSITLDGSFVIRDQNCPANDSAGRLKMLFVNGLR